MDKFENKKKFNEKEFWEKRTKTYLEETKHIDEWYKKDN
jgi:hypothetical protein